MQTTTITTPRGVNIGNNIINTLKTTYNYANVEIKKLYTVRNPKQRANTTTVSFIIIPKSMNISIFIRTYNA